MRAYVWLLYDKMNFTIMERVLHFILDFVNACRFSKNISGYTSGTLFNSTDMVIEENYSHESQYNLYLIGATYFYIFVKLNLCHSQTL